MTSIIKQSRTWHRATEKAGQAQIADVARRAGNIDREALAWRAALPAYYKAKPTHARGYLRGKAPVPIVAVCPDGTVEHYESVVMAAEAMNYNVAAFRFYLDRPDRRCRDRRWYRAGTYHAERGKI